jgi:hypothetical protein
MHDYDYARGALADAQTLPQDVRRVGLLSIKRSLAGKVYVADERYTAPS